MNKLEKLPMETYNALKKVFDESTMSRTAVFRWYWLFRDACESADEKPCSGHPSSMRATDLVGRVGAVANADR